MSNLVKHAERELRKAGLFDQDSDYNGMIAEAIAKKLVYDPQSDLTRQGLMFQMLELLKKD